MNAGFAVSDLVLALVCAFVAWRAARERPGIALACGTIGAAAFVGVMRFSGLEAATGAHKFLSLIGGVAALPLLAASLAWPDAKAATNIRDASLALLVCSAVGIALVAGAGFAIWGQAVPAASVVAMLVCAVRERADGRVLGAAALLVTFYLVSANRTQIAGFAPIEVLHYGMAAGLLLLCL